MDYANVTEAEIYNEILAALKARGVEAAPRMQNGQAGTNGVIVNGRDVAISIHRQRTPGGLMWKPSDGPWAVAIGWDRKNKHRWSAKRERGLDYAAIAEQIEGVVQRSIRERQCADVSIANRRALDARLGLSEEDHRYSYHVTGPGGCDIQPTTVAGRYDVARRVDVRRLTLDQALALDEALGALLKQFEGDVA